MLSDLRCYYHPDREATGQCDRCGDYLCDECKREWTDRTLCVVCIENLNQVEPEGVVLVVLNLVGALSFWPLCSRQIAMVCGLVVFLAALIGFWWWRPSGVLGLSAPRRSVGALSVFGVLCVVFRMVHTGIAAWCAALDLGSWVIVMMARGGLLIAPLAFSVVCWSEAAGQGVRPHWALGMAHPLVVLFLGFAGWLYGIVR